MIRYSIFPQYRNCTREDAKALLETSDKQVLWTYGLRYRNPTTLDRPIAREYALELFENETCDVDEYEDHIKLNTFSSNDLW